LGWALELPPLQSGFAGQPAKQRTRAVVATAMIEAALRVLENWRIV